jgi:hypothetical protein
MSGPRHADRPSHTEGSPLDPDALEVAPGALHETVQGWIPQLATEEELRIALEKAFDYRGDVMLTLKDNSKIEGYIFDRVAGKTLASSFVRLMPKDANQKLKISYANIAALSFTGKDGISRITPPDGHFPP